MSIESVPYPTREISDNLPLFLSDIGAVAVPISVTGAQTIVATKGSTYITYGTGTITFTDPNILTSVSGDYYKVIVGGTSVAVIGGVTYNKVSPVEIIRLVSAGAWITHSGLDASQIISGTIDAARLPSYVDDVLEIANFAAFPVTGETGKIYIAVDTNKTYRWSGTVYIEINAEQTITLTSDVTGSGTGSFATTIASGAVSLAKMANVSTGTVFYRKTSGSGAPEVQSLSTLKTDLGLTGTNSGDQDLNALTPITLGSGNTASGTDASAVGKTNTASGTNSCAVGRSNSASGSGSSAFGNQVITSVAGTQEFGIGNGSARLSSVRVHDDGYVALSLRDTATALTDGGATVGAEADGTLMRGAYAIRRNGSSLFIDANSSAGTVTSARIGDVSLDGSEVLTNKTLTNPTINNYTEGVVAIGNSGTAKTIALTSGTFQTVTLTGSCTFTMPTATAGKSFILKVMTGTGGFTATFTGVKWSDNVVPVITATADRYDLLSFIADGTAWSGSAIQNFTTFNPII